MKPKKLDARAKILDAALHLFSANGFNATTTKSIAKSATVNEVTLFRHFKSKVELFNSVMEHIKLTGFSADRVIDRDLDPIEGIKKLIRDCIQLLVNHQEAYRIMQYAHLELVEGYRENFLNDQKFKLLNYLEPAFTELQKSKRIRHQTEPLLLSKLILTQILGAVDGILFLDETDFTKERIKEIIQGIIHLYLK